MQNTFISDYYCANFVKFTSFIVHGGSRLCTSANWGWCAVCARQIGACVSSMQMVSVLASMQMVSVVVEHADGLSSMQMVSVVEHADGFCFTQLHFACHHRLLLQDRSLRHLRKMYFPSTFYMEGNLYFRVLTAYSLHWSIRSFQKRNFTQSTKCCSLNLELTAPTAQANIFRQNPADWQHWSVDNSNN
jgi:hypothetical protein